MSRQNISADKLRAISGHISYEVEMFEFAADRLRRGVSNQYEMNSTLEILIIHARCLYDFIYPSQVVRPDDVIADDFFDDPTEFHSQLPETLELSNFLKQRAGKEIAHLTYGRLDVKPEEKGWHFIKIQAEMNSALLVFFNCLSEDKRAWFPSIVSQTNN